MPDIQSLRSLIEVADKRQAQDEAQRARTFSASFHKWAERSFSAELRQTLKWSYEWDDEKRRPYAHFSIENGRQQFIFRLYRGESFAAAHLALVSPTHQTVDLQTEHHAEDELLLAIRAWLQ